MVAVMRKIALLGSTGSIGRQTLDVVAANPDKMEVKVLAAGSSVELMLNQIERFHPDFAVLSDKEAALQLKKNYKGPTEILSGEEGILAAATYEEVDTVLGAMSGYVGLKPTMAAINSGKDIALANKETLVAAGEIVMEAVRRNNVALLPVDSEHSAIFQSLRAGKHSEIKKLILTASGGPFRGKTRRELRNCTLDECLNHPNWSMGKKITVDSSTLANKGLEVIEAHWLFDVDYENIDVLVHPESVVHSMVEFHDGAVIAQMGLPDMKLPIQYALSYPERYNVSYGELDLLKYGSLHFEAPDTVNFPALKIAVACGKEGGSLPCVFNAANEECVYAFLQGKISYTDITDIPLRVVQSHLKIESPTLEEIAQVDAEARKRTRAFIKMSM